MANMYSGYRAAVRRRLETFASAVELDEEFVTHDTTESKNDLCSDWLDYCYSEMQKKPPFGGELSRSELNEIGNFESFLEDAEWPAIRNEARRLLSIMGV